MKEQSQSWGINMLTGNDTMLNATSVDMAGAVEDEDTAVWGMPKFKDDQLANLTDEQYLAMVRAISFYSEPWFSFLRPSFRRVSLFNRSREKQRKTEIRSGWPV